MKPYANPYFAGVGLGAVLLAAFVFAGRGLGASGAFAAAGSALVGTVAPAAASRSDYFTGYLAGGPLWRDWLLLELAGAILGGFVSAVAAHRFRVAVDRGPRAAVPLRLTAAASGGAVMGAGAVLARGCTSGQALTGGALLSVGSWTFMLAFFAAAYAAAPAVRRLWQ